MSAKKISLISIALITILSVNQAHSKLMFLKTATAKVLETANSKKGQIKTEQ